MKLNRQFELDDTCVLYLPMWRYGKENGSLIHDHSSTHSDVTLYGVTPADRGWYFDGVDDYISVPNITIPDNFTISMWLCPIASSDDYASLFTQQYNRGIFFRGTIGKIDFVANDLDHVNNTAVPNNVWTHIVITCAGGAGNFYLNAIVDGSYAGGTGFIANRMGNDNISENFKGKIGEITVWNRSLTAQEIQNIFETTRRFYGE